MKDIDVREWKEYILENLFDFVNSKAYHSKDVTEIQDNNSGINYITRSKFNNGLKCRVVKRDDYVINPKGTISFGAENADFFYQAEEYITGNKMYYIDTRNISKKAGLFLKSILENAFTKNFSFTDGMVPDRIKKEKIKLPSKLNKKGEYEPDWQYMEDYIKEIEKKVQFSSVQFSLSSKTEKENVDCQKWKYFHLYDIFDIDMGTKLDRIKMKMDNPTIDFVGRANAEQGVTTKVNKIDGLEPYKSGYLTLALGGAYLGSCFIQKNNFYTSQNVIVLIPKKEMTFKVKQFISTSIFVESQLHYKAFIDELNPHVKTDFQFKLPVDENGNPDWNYMENYIAKVEEKTNTRMSYLKQTTE